MKNLKLCLIGISLCAGAAHAQQLESQKNLLRSELSLGGSLRASDDTNDNGSFSTSKSLSASGSYLWFLGENFELGPEISYSGQWRKTPSYTYHTWSMGAGPRLKYNFWQVYRAPYVPYLVAGAQLNYGMSDVITPVNKNTGDQTYLGGGLTFPIREIAALYLECQYNWSHSKSKYDVPSGSSDDGVDVQTSHDLWTFVGVNLYL